MRPFVLQDTHMPNSPEAPKPSTVCGAQPPCDDPAVVLVRSMDNPSGTRLCVPHALDVAQGAVTLAASATRGRFTRSLRVTVEPLPVDYDAPIPFVLVDPEHIARDVAQLRQAQRPEAPTSSVWAAWCGVCSDASCIDCTARRADLDRGLAGVDESDLTELRDLTGPAL